MEKKKDLRMRGGTGRDRGQETGAGAGGSKKRKRRRAAWAGRLRRKLAGGEEEKTLGG